MLASRGMGDINPSKMPKARVVKKRDGDYPVDVYAEGGKVTASQRADGIAAKGKTRGKMY